MAERMTFQQSSQGLVAWSDLPASHEVLELPCTQAGVQICLSCTSPDSLWHNPTGANDLAPYQIREQGRYELTLSPVNTSLEGWLGQKALSIRRYGSAAVVAVEPGNYVGRSRLLVRAEGAVLLDQPIEVRSCKIDYLQHYRALLDELADWVASLVFSIGTPTDSPAAISGTETMPPYLTYLLLHRMMSPTYLPGAVQLIAGHPDRRLIREEVERDIGTVRALSPRALQHLLSHPQQLQATARAGLAPSLRRSLRGRLPSCMLEERVRLDFDTPANRFVRHTIGLIHARALSLERAFLLDAKQVDSKTAQQSHILASQCRRWRRDASLWQHQTFLREVGPMGSLPSQSQVLLRRDGYRETRRAYDLLHRTLRVRWPGLERLLAIPNKDLATLYEYWGMLAICQSVAALAGLKLDWRQFLKLRQGLYQVRLHERGSMSVPIGSWRIDYNRTLARSKRAGHGSYSLPMRPDYSLWNGSTLWVFDAKYRLDSGKMIMEFGEGEPPKKFKPTDLYKMHTYRDALKQARGAFTLYPGDQFRAFDTQGRLYRDPDQIKPDFEGVGAVPLMPGSVDHLTRLLRRLL